MQYVACIHKNAVPKVEAATTCMYSETLKICFLDIMVTVTEYEEHRRDHGDGRNLLKETHHQKEDDLVLGIQDMMMVAVLDITMKEIAKHRAKGNREEIASIADRFIEMFSLYK